MKPDNKRSCQTISRKQRYRGFTLMEVMLSVVFLGLLAAAILSVYSSGFQSLEEQTNRMLLDSKLSSRMETLLSTPFAALTSGSENVTIKTKEYIITWNAVPVDLNNDGTPEPNARQITVSVSGVSGLSLTTIVVDQEDKVGKIS